MNNSSFNNFNFQNLPQGYSPYGYFPQATGPSFFNYYHSQPCNIIPRPFYTPFQPLTIEQRQLSFIKIQQESHSHQDLNKHKKETKQKLSKNRKSLPKISQINKNIYEHPPKLVKHKVKYFDPNSSPIVTSNGYNLVETDEKEIQRQQLMYSENTGIINQIQFPEQDENIFIVYKHRRIKKKFKKYIKPKYQNFNNQEAEGSDNNSDNSSDLSESSSNNVQQNKDSNQSNNAGSKQGPKKNNQIRNQAQHQQTTNAKKSNTTKLAV